jgi:putative membrane protein
MRFFHNIKEFLKIFSKDENQLENLVTKGLTLLSLGLLVAALLIILLIINLLRTWIKYYQFNVSKHQDSLMISAGLLAKKHTLLKPSKVQITSYSQNYFQKKLAIFNLNLKQAHSGKAQSEHDSQQANLAIPGCSPDEKAHLLRIILGQLPVAEQTFKPNIRFLNLPLFFKVALPIGIYLWCWFTFKEVQPYYPLAILYAVLAVPMIYISYCRHRLSVSQDFIIKKSGIWDISNEIILPHKIQAITTFQYPWHKAVDVGHVNLHTAAGVIHFKYGNYSQIKQLVNYWLYQIESGDENWM